MDTREYIRAKEHHAGLLCISQQEHRLRQSQASHLSLLDWSLLFAGDTLISMGKRMKQRVVVYHLKENRL
jgi:hypothetical protein